MQEKTDQKYTKYEHFSRSCHEIISYKFIVSLKKMWLIFVLDSYCTKTFANMMVL